MIVVDPVGVHAEGGESVVLRSEVLGVGRVIVRSRRASSLPPVTYTAEYVTPQMCSARVLRLSHNPSIILRLVNGALPDDETATTRRTRLAGVIVSNPAVSVAQGRPRPA